MYVPSFAKGKDSPTSFIAAVALAVKTTVYSGGARKNASTLSRASLTQSALNWELQRVGQVMMVGGTAELVLPVVHRVGVPEDVLLKERRMHTDEGLGVEGPSHIIDENFPRLFQPCKIALPQGVQEPCKFVFGVLSQEIFVSGCGVALDEIGSNESFVEKWGRERDRMACPLNRKPLFGVVNNGFL